MFAKIKHVAIITENYDRSAEFYKTIFGMKQITSGMTDDNGHPNPERGFLGDGVIELARLRRDPGNRTGLDHFGFEVEDSVKAVERIQEHFPDVMIRKSLATVPFAEKRAHDPLGVSFDISQKAVIKPQATRYVPGHKDEGWDQPRHFNHISIRVCRPDRSAKLFRKVFELEEVPNYDGKGICLTDGWSYLVIRPCETINYDTMKNGLDHAGFKVEDLEVVKNGLEEIAKTFPLAAGPKIDLPHRPFGEITRGALDAFVLGKHAACDPSGVLIDLTT